jgi:transcriptional regulator with XRE-family HTH domain
LTFREAQCRLLEDLRHRIHNGDLTERGLARISGISQPHVHNVLKGVRFLSPGFLDAILKSLNYSLLDLSTQRELNSHTASRFQPHSTFQLRLLDSPIGPRMPWLGSATLKRKFSLPADLENSPPDLVVACLQPDPRMDLCLAGADLAVLDLKLRWRTNIDPNGIYVISHAGESILRYVRPGKSCLYLAAADNFDSPIGWDTLPLDASGIEAPVRARAIWIGREEQLPLRPHQCGRFLVDATSS